MDRQNWEKHISVDRRIVRLLSASTYEDFPGAIREMVSNAFDADATKIQIQIDLDEDLITVSDNGNGMTPEQFDFFLRIAGQQRDKMISPEFERKRIGIFGIGFMAIFPFGRRIKVSSSARRSDIYWEATIPTDRFIQDDREGLTINVEDVQIPGYEISAKKYRDNHGTTITVTGLTEMVERYFRDRDITKKQRTIRGWPPFKQLEWTLREDLPIEYPPKSTYEEAFSDLGKSGIRVFLNGNQLYRNVHASHILENSSWEFNKVKCRYVISSDWKAIAPYEARYIKLRLRNVGIGSRTPFGLGTEGRAYSRLHWLTGEIHILEGFENLLTVDRKRFIETPEYDHFYDFFRKKLAKHQYYLETVSVAEKNIKRQLTESRFAEVGSRKKIITRNINTLKKRGFNVIQKTKSGSKRSTKPVKINIESKVVEVFKDHPSFRDTIKIGAEEIPVRYEKWDTGSGRFPAVLRDKDGIILINTNYPLFNSRRYGEVFKKVLVTTLILSEKVASKKALFSSLCKQLQDEFEDLG